MNKFSINTMVGTIPVRNNGNPVYKIIIPVSALISQVEYAMFYGWL